MFERGDVGAAGGRDSDCKIRMGLRVDREARRGDSVCGVFGGSAAAEQGAEGFIGQVGMRIIRFEIRGRGHRVWAL